MLRHLWVLRYDVPTVPAVKTEPPALLVVFDVASAIYAAMSFDLTRMSRVALLAKHGMTPGNPNIPEKEALLSA